MRQAFAQKGFTRLAVGALLVTVLEVHLIFAIMAAFTGAAVLYLLISLRGNLFRPDRSSAPQSAPPSEPPPDPMAVEPGLSPPVLGVLPVG